MVQYILVVTLLMHGLGHTVGFWMPVPPWFALLWTLPGVGFLVGAWGVWNDDAWWPAVVMLSSMASVVVLTFPTGVLHLTPFRSALGLNLVMFAAVGLFSVRRVLTGL